MLKALRSRKFYVPLITIGGALVLFFIYYFFYVGSRRSYADERAFRLLSAVSGQLSQKVASIRDILAASAESDETVPIYLIRNGFTNVIPKKKFDETKLSGEEKNSLHARKGTLWLSLLDKPGQFELLAEYRVGESNLEAVPAGKSGSRPDPKGFCDQTHPTSICANTDLLTDLRKSLLNVPEEFFDDILISTAAGDVLFQRNPSGLRFANLDAVLSVQPPATPLPSADGSGKAKSVANPPSAFQQASQFSNVKTVSIGGANYRLYFQPLPVEVWDQEGKSVKPIVCGLRRSERLESEVVSIPYTVLTWGVLVLLSAIGLLWPLLKVHYMSASERLRRGSVFSLLFSALFVTSLLTVTVLNGAYSLRDSEEAQEQIQSLAAHIDQNIQDELRHALKFMDALDGKDSLYLGLQKALTKKKWDPETSFLQHDFFKPHGDLDFYYPYFDNVFWADEVGQQAFKLTVQPVATPRTNVAEQLYFKDVLAGHLTNLEGLKLTNLEGLKRGYRFDSLYSPNTGDFLVLLARPYTSASEKRDLREPVKHLKAQVLVSQFLSLVNPVVPPGYGFAVVDREGMVQFHSDSSRNKIEDFFKESRENVALKTLVAKGGTDFLELDYMGKPHKAYVVPLPYLGAPSPALVVFRETNYYSTINVACLLVFALLAGMICLPLLILLAILTFILWPDYPLASRWPEASSVGRYVAIMSANTCVALAFVIRFPGMRMNELLVDVFALVTVALFACVSSSEEAKAASPGDMPADWVVFLRSKWDVVYQAVVLVAILWIACFGPALFAVNHWLSWSSLALLVVAPLYVALSSSIKSKRFTEFAQDSVALKDLYLGMVFSLLFVLVVLPAFGLFKISYNTVNRLALQSAQLARWDQLNDRAGQIKDRAVKLFSPADPIKGVVAQANENTLRLEERLKMFKMFKDDRLKKDWDRYDNAVYYPKERSDEDPLGLKLKEALDLKEAKPPAGPQGPDVSWLQLSIAQASALFPSNRIGTELRETAIGEAARETAVAQPKTADKTDHDNKDDISWKSAEDGDDQLLWLTKDPHADPVVTEQQSYVPIVDQNLTISNTNELLGVYPLWQPPKGTILFAVPLTVLLWFWLRYLIQRVFLTDLEDAPPLQTWKPLDAETRNLMIIAHPRSGKSAQLEDADMLDLLTAGSWTLPSLSHPTTVVDHFEFDMDNPDTGMRKLSLLEQLLYVKKKRVVLLSAVDPMFYLETSAPESVTPSGPGQAPAAQVLARWAAVLSLFEKQQIEDLSEEDFNRDIQEMKRTDQHWTQLRKMVEIECNHTAQLRRIGLAMLAAHCHEKPMTRGAFLEELLDRADSYYRVLWSTCSKTERLVLFQLAQDGWANPKNERAIQQLQRRKIICKEFGFRIMNQSFTRFVRSGQSPEEVLKWEEEEQHSMWSTVRLGLSTALLMLGAWLLYAQQDVFQLGIGYLAALGTASGAIINLMRNMSGSRGAAGSGTPVN